jgi:hypothetical protein
MLENNNKIESMLQEIQQATIGPGIDDNNNHNYDQVHVIKVIGNNVPTPPDKGLKPNFSSGG